MYREKRLPAGVVVVGASGAGAILISVVDTVGQIGMRAVYIAGWMLISICVHLVIATSQTTRINEAIHNAHRCGHTDGYDHGIDSAAATITKRLAEDLPHIGGNGTNGTATTRRLSS